MYTMEYYSAIKKNEIMLFAATWMGLKIIILNEVRKKIRHGWIGSLVLADANLIYKMDKQHGPTF